MKRCIMIAAVIVMFGSVIYFLHRISCNGRYRLAFGEIAEIESKFVNDELVTSNKVVPKCFLVDTSTGRVSVYEHDHWQTLAGEMKTSVGFYPVSR